MHSRAAVAPGPVSAPKPSLPAALEERLSLLRASQERTRRRLLLQDSALRGLQEELSDAGAKLRGLERLAAPVQPAPAAAPPLARRPAPNPAWLKLVPWGALPAVGLALSLASPAARPSPPPAPVPAPAVLVAPAPAPPEPRAAAEEEDEARQDTIGLVLDFRPEGASGTVAELLRPELEASSDGHPWVLERTGQASYLVAFRPYGEALGYETPIYEFEVDLARGSVTPSPETLRSLVGPGS